MTYIEPQNNKYSLHLMQVAFIANHSLVREIVPDPSLNFKEFVITKVSYKTRVSQETR